MRLFVLLMVLSGLVGGASGGCATTPIGRWARAREGLSAAEDTVVDLSAAGRLSDADLARLSPIFAYAQERLADMKARIDAGRDAAGGVWADRLTVARDLLARARRYAQARAAGASPADAVFYLLNPDGTWPEGLEVDERFGDVVPEPPATGEAGAADEGSGS